MEIHSKLLIAADGRFSKTRYMANIKYRFHDYKQKAFVFNIIHEKPHNGIALERFFPTGPLAILPVRDLKKHISSVVWTMDNIDADKDFFQEFQLRYNNFFGKVKIITKRFED